MMAAKNNKTIKEKSRKIVRLSLAAAALLPWPNMAQAQLTVTCFRNLAWGSFGTCGGGGKITVTPNSASNVTVVGCIASFTAPQRALCKVRSLTATTTGTLQIVVTAKKDSLNKGGSTMDVSKFNIDTKNGGPTKTFTPGDLTTNTFTFGVGARLTVNNGQAYGAYAGQISLIATYTP